MLLALLLGLSTEKNGAAAAGCPAEIVSASDNTWSVDFDNRTDVAESEFFSIRFTSVVLDTNFSKAPRESSYVESLKDEFEKLEATGLHGTGMFSFPILFTRRHVN